MNIGWLIFGYAVRRQQAIHQAMQAICFLDDDLGVFLEAGLRELEFQQLGRTPQATQWIADLMGQIAQ